IRTLGSDVQNPSRLLALSTRTPPAHSSLHSIFSPCRTQVHWVDAASRRRRARPDLSHELHFHDGARAEGVGEFVALDDAQAELAFGGLMRGFGDLGGRIRTFIEEYAGAAAHRGGEERRGAV